MSIRAHVTGFAHQAHGLHPVRAESAPFHAYKDPRAESAKSCRLPACRAIFDLEEASCKGQCSLAASTRSLMLSNLSLSVLD